MWNIMCDGETFAAFPVEIIEGLWTDEMVG
jgi:hypothetical protein